jgi:molybdenum-dependent DNA-binding transcriptional regulator ModE
MDQVQDLSEPTLQGPIMLRYTLRQLEYFVAVGETGSIARASERINVSSLSMSSAISQLEHEFGFENV